MTRLMILLTTLSLVLLAVSGHVKGHSDIQVISNSRILRNADYRDSFASLNEKQTFDKSSGKTNGISSFDAKEFDSKELEQQRAEEDEDDDAETDFFAFLRRSKAETTNDDGNIGSNKQRRRKAQESTSTRVNIFQKLGESLGTSIVGFILIIFMPCLIWRNEGRHVNQLSRIDFCKNNAVAVDCNTASNDTVGRLVHFTGNVTVGDTVLDLGEKAGSLNVSKPVENALVLRRTCYIFQKFEVASQSTQKDMIGGGETRTTTYSIKEDWTALGPQKDCPHLNESNSRGIWDQLLAVTGGAEEAVSGYTPAQEEMDAKRKPGMSMQQQGPMPLELAQALGIFNPNLPPQAMSISHVARVGEFFLSEKVITANPAVFLSSAIPIPNEYIPDTVSGCEDLQKGSDNVLRTFSEEGQPQNGDCKVVFDYVPANFDASFVVAQTAGISEEGKDSGAKYGIDEAQVTGRCKNDLGQIWMVRKGVHNLYEMLDMAKEEENKLTMIIRVVGWALLCVGWVLLFSPFLTALQVLPLLSQLGYFAVVLVALIVSCLCCSTIMIVAYMRYRPVITGALLVVALGIWGVVAWRLNVAAETGGDSAAPTPAPV